MRQSLVTALWAWSYWASASASAHTFPERDVPAVISMDLYGSKISKPLQKRDTATLATNVLNEVRPGESLLRIEF